ncbi:hypothetical protein HYW58_03220 [Candidatus Kaiserbacteria bacterium]|nr:hypothetical protein [Candidatus Kaiserbacteria bacterium]
MAIPRNIKTAWNLKQFYASPSDPQIEKDIRTAEKAYALFAKKYRNRKDYLTNERKLLSALRDHDTLIEKSSLGNKPIYYFGYIQELNSFDTKAEAMSRKLGNRLTKASHKVLFFDIALGNIKPKKRKSFLSSRILKKYHYFLKRIFIESDYQLSEKEEKILSLKGLPGRTMWIEGVSKLVQKQEIRFGQKKIPIAEASNLISTLPVSKRRELHAATMAQLESVSDFAESEINAIFTDKKINDELRGFKKPYSATVLGYENDEKGVENLVAAVTADFSTSREFYSLKKKLLKLKELTYADRSVGIGRIKRTFTFNESYELLRRILYNMGKEYGTILDRFVHKGHIDAFPNRGKSGGAYCSFGINEPTFVLLNHVPSFNSLMTFAHEMGHAIHSEMSKIQPPLYQGYTTSVAETASTFFEMVVFNAIFQTLHEREKIIALHDRIQDDISTIYRQIAFFNFELELHKKIREEGNVPKEEIARMLNRHMRAYIGPSMSFQRHDGYFFVAVSHFRRPFYVYSYTYGQLISKALYERYEKDPRYIDDIRLFLNAGGSKSPEDIFGGIGLNVTKPTLFKEGLANVKRNIARLKKLTA